MLTRVRHSHLTTLPQALAVLAGLGSTDAETLRAGRVNGVEGGGGKRYVILLIRSLLL